MQGRLDAPFTSARSSHVCARYWVMNRDGLRDVCCQEVDAQGVHALLRQFEGESKIQDLGLYSIILTTECIYFQVSRQEEKAVKRAF